MKSTKQQSNSKHYTSSLLLIHSTTPRARGCVLPTEGGAPLLHSACAVFTPCGYLPDCLGQWRVNLNAAAFEWL
ncbi:hypothetical protein JYU34_020881 [Plutella xylostella]|uniref:Uncharacterized protein n=1 Tax=Plutella xylostella TaxID=51655 RepID=A0ABQ7PS70_PLUXY|nr:hypothetical protein JYU34_020881 [Plutella xylostella]